MLVVAGDIVVERVVGGAVGCYPAEAVGYSEDAADLVVDGGFFDFAGFDGGDEGFGIHVPAEGHFEVEAGVGGGDAVVGGGPVRHHDAVEVPLVLGDVDVEVGVLGGVFAVDEVVAIHNGADVGLFDGSLKGGQVDLAEGALADDGVGGEAGVFAVVGGEVLDGGGDVLGLDSVDVADGDLGGEEGVFAEVLEVAAVHGGAVDIDAGAEEEGDTAGAGVAAELGADALG